MGHAKVLMGLATPEAQQAMAARITAQGLSVRQTETLAKQQPKSPITYRTIAAQAVQDPNVQAALREIERALGTRVRLIGDDLHGKIVIEYHSPDDLDRIYGVLLGRK